MPDADFYLWQLISPALPVGSYAYSQGMESAVEHAYVINEQQAQEWIMDILSHNLSKLDGPVFCRMYDFWQAGNWQQLLYWNDFLLASRESAEFYAEDRQLGKALLKLAQGLDMGEQCEKTLIKLQALEHGVVYVLVLSYLAVHWKIPAIKMLQGLYWSWAENQVAAAIKLVPLGQLSGQRILSRIIPLCEELAHQSSVIPDGQIGSMTPGLSLLSARHEQQYSRLFRS